MKSRIGMLAAHALVAGAMFGCGGVSEGMNPTVSQADDSVSDLMPFPRGDDESSLALVRPNELPIESPSLRLELAAIVGNGIPDKEVEWKDQIHGIIWANDDILIYGGGSGFVKCHDLRTISEVWNVQLPRRTYNLVVGGDKVFGLDEHWTLHVLDLNSGAAIETVVPDVFEQAIGKKFVHPNNMAWLPKRNCLLIADQEDAYGENVYLMNPQTFGVVGRMKADGFVTAMHYTSDEEYVVTLSNRNNIRIWSFAENREIFRMGWNQDVMIDAPRICMAVYDGRETLIYCIGNAWGPGTTHIYNIRQGQEVARIEYSNSPIDVDFEASRLVMANLSPTKSKGLAQSIMLIDFSGRVLGKLDDAAPQLITAMKLSPDRTRLAVASKDANVRIYHVRDHKDLELMP